MQHKIYFWGIVLLFTYACSDDHFISDSIYRATVKKEFQKKIDAIENKQLFTVFNQSLSRPEREALEFLYAYMPLGDVSDYSGEFYLENVRSSFSVRKEMPWGAMIPEGIFRHFVLPIRINNETLDSSRTAFYAELKDRVKNLSMYDAVLEVNHWCHEKVVYTPSDSRTSSPLASVKSAYGRCGEESTFTTAALRAVGIPARQVYVPRWAHTDDNHAWVEAWVDGKWYFLGACEPEPVLGLGWFNAPAYRSLLMQTRAFGFYQGPEEVLENTSCFTTINVTGNYVEVAAADIMVVDENNQPQADATVRLGIYNYAEFYTAKESFTNSRGCIHMTAGKGDMVAWASKEGRFGIGKVSFGKESTVTIKLDRKEGDKFSLDLDLIPPPEGTIPAEATEEQKAACSLRLHAEDSIRNLYVSTFMSEDEARTLAAELNLPADRTARFMIASRGNHAQLNSFLQNVPKERRLSALDLLSVISAKDLRDTPSEVLLDHLLHTTPGNEDLHTQYVLNPRVDNEFLSAYRSVLQKEFDPQLAAKARKDPRVLVEYCKQIKVDDKLNPQSIPIMVTGVWRMKMADTHSRNIFFVALCRSLGIPARIETVTKKTQYYTEGQWMEADFIQDSAPTPVYGTVEMEYRPIKGNENPKYETHFTLAKITHLFPTTLDFASRRTVDMGSSDTWKGLFSQPLELETGYYATISGSRMANGSVLCHIETWNVAGKQPTKTRLVMRESSEEIAVIGNIDAEAKFLPLDNPQPQSILSTTGRGYFVVAILGVKQEPTNHALRGFVKEAAEFEQWGRRMIFLFPDQQSASKFEPNEFGTLPSTVTFGIDTDKKITRMIASAMNLKKEENLPIVIIADTFGRVVYCSQGYNITLTDQMLKVISKL